MLISAREASQELREVGLSRTSALKVLDSGLAGEPVRTRSSVLYEGESVRALAARRQLDWTEAMALAPAGIFVARRDVGIYDSRQDQVAASSGGWGGIGLWTWVWMGFLLREHEALVLTAPGHWFDQVNGCWLLTGPGRPFVLGLGQPSREGLDPQSVRH